MSEKRYLMTSEDFKELGRARTDSLISSAFGGVFLALFVTSLFSSISRGGNQRWAASLIFATVMVISFSSAMHARQRTRAVFARVREREIKS
jgi:hypothetical protein